MRTAYLDDFSSPFSRFHLDIAHFIDQPLYSIEPFLAHRQEDWAYVQHFAGILHKQLLMLPPSKLEQGAYREARSINDLDVQAVPLFVCARYLWHMGAHTQNSPDWGIDFLNDKYFDTHLKRLRDAESDYLKEA